MLKITVELHPFGDKTKARKIAEMDLWNDGTGSRNLGNYRARLSTSESVYNVAEKKEGTVENYDRLQSVWFLVSQMLKDMGYEA